jgi:AAA domain, putative AbiEii toxin, Type IV TA system
MLQFTSLEITRFRGLARPVKLHFGPRYNLVIGDNGAGKTNLLRLVSMALSLDFGELYGEFFELRWQVRDDAAGDSVEGWISVRERPLPEGTPDTMMRDFAPPSVLSWKLILDSLQGSETAEETDVEVSRERLSLLGVMLTKFGEIYKSFHKYLRSNSGRMDEALELFRRLTGGPSTEGGTDAKTLTVDVFVVGSEVVAVAGIPGADSATVSRWGREVQGPNGPPLTHRDLVWLEKFRADLGVDAVNLRPLFKEKRQAGKGEVIRFSGAEINVALTEHKTVRSELLSYGQKRMLALRYYLAAYTQGPAIIDELSNGLHHAWVESILKDLEERQSLLATQNPLVMDALWWESPEEVAQSIILCTRDAQHGWNWRQFDAEEARRFFDAWKSGFQQIHEVLRTERWW